MPAFVESSIEPAISLDREIDHGRDLSLVRNIASYGEKVVNFLTQFLSGIVQKLFVLIGHHYRGTRQGERFCCGESDAASRSSDKCYFSFESSVHLVFQVLTVCITFGFATSSSFQVAVSKFVLLHF